MKKLYTLTFALLFCLSAQAAYYYQFSTSTSAYTELSNPTIITTEFDQESYELTLGTFKLFGVDWDTMDVQMFGAIIGRNNTHDRMFAADGFSVKRFVKRDNTSHVSYTFEGTAGNRILKVQFKNAGLKYGDAEDDFVNFQIWLYENGDKIEMHIGSSYITDPSKVFTFSTDMGPQIGIFHSNLDFTVKHEVLWLGGNPSSPNVNTSLAASLNGIPASGRVYTFEHKVIPDQAKLELKAPIAMENWKVGEVREIKWTSTLVRKIKIEYSYMGPDNYTVIVDSVDAASGKYLWTVPNTVSDQCFVKITDVDKPTRYSETAIPFAIKAAGTGVFEMNNASGEFIIYPNPGNGTYMISAKNASVQNITVTNLQGKIIYSENYSTQKTGNKIINISNFPAGVYMVKIKTADTYLTKSVIKN